METDTKETSELQESNQLTPSGPATIALPVPRLDIQTIALALVAVITIFQTIQLFRIQNVLGASSIKLTAPKSASSPTSPTNDAPAAMVGGC